MLRDGTMNQSERTLMVAGEDSEAHERCSAWIPLAVTSVETNGIFFSSECKRKEGLHFSLKDGRHGVWWIAFRYVSGEGVSPRRNFQGISMKLSSLWKL